MLARPFTVTSFDRHTLPTLRTVYYQRYKNEPSDEKFEAYVKLRADHPGIMSTCAHYMKVLSVEKNKTLFITDHMEYINRIVAAYDFIAIMERMEESAVALAMLLNVPLADVLYLSAKQNGGYDEVSERLVVDGPSVPCIGTFLTLSLSRKRLDLKRDAPTSFPALFPKE